MQKELGCAHPEIVLHLDHGDSFEFANLVSIGILFCNDRRFSPCLYEENVALTKKVVEYAHQFDVTVEGELGVLAGVEDEVSAEHHTYTNPEEVIDFATRTGCDSLAINWYFSRCQVQTRNSATLIRLQVVWFLLHWNLPLDAVMENFRDSLSFFTVLLLFLGKKLILSTSSVASLEAAIGIPWRPVA